MYCIDGKKGGKQNKYVLSENVVSEKEPDTSPEKRALRILKRQNKRPGRKDVEKKRRAYSRKSAACLKEKIRDDVRRLWADE